MSHEQEILQLGNLLTARTLQDSMGEPAPDTSTCAHCGGHWEEHDLILHEEGRICVLCEAELLREAEARRHGPGFGLLLGLVPLVLAGAGTWVAWWWQNWPDLGHISPPELGPGLGLVSALVGLGAVLHGRRAQRLLETADEDGPHRLWSSALTLAWLAVALGVLGPLLFPWLWPLEDHIDLQIYRHGKGCVPYLGGEPLERKGLGWDLPRPKAGQGVLVLCPDPRWGALDCVAWRTPPHTRRSPPGAMTWGKWRIEGLPEDARVYLGSASCTAELVRSPSGELYLPPLDPGTYDISLGQPFYDLGVTQERGVALTEREAGLIPPERGNVLTMRGRVGTILLSGGDLLETSVIPVVWLGRPR